MAKQPAAGIVLTTRALSRATLARQGLLERTDRGVLDTIEHLVGMQSQVPTDPYVALWSRLRSFDPVTLEALTLEKAVARVPSLRGTIHLTSARDSLGIRALVQPVLARAQRGAFGKSLGDADLDALAEEGRALLHEQSLTFLQLRRALGEQWAAYDQTAVAYSISYLVPLVQVPPRGLWSSTAQPTWTTAEAWLGKQRKRDRVTLEELALRYLAAFGPASVQDMQSWCGLTRLSEVFEPLRPRLVTFRDERGAELFDLPDAPRPDAATPAPVRFLPQYDNAFLGHANRARIVPEDIPPAWGAAAQGGWMSPVLVDGFITGLWRVVRRPGKTGAATLRVHEVANARSWRKRDRTAVMTEATRLLEFLAPRASKREVELVGPGYRFRAVALDRGGCGARIGVVVRLRAAMLYNASAPSFPRCDAPKGRLHGIVRRHPDHRVRPVHQRVVLRAHVRRPRRRGHQDRGSAGR